jgi:hypothetical protein
MIAKDFHSVKDFRQIRGKSFVIIVGVAIPAVLSGHIGQVIARRPARIVWRGSHASHAPHPRGMGETVVAVVRSS